MKHLTPFQNPMLLSGFSPRIHLREFEICNSYIYIYIYIYIYKRRIDMPMKKKTKHTIIIYTLSAWAEEKPDCNSAEELDIQIREYLGYDTRPYLIVKLYS